MPSNGVPDSPVSGLAAAAIQVHEVFTAYVEAGFTRAEALELTKVILQWQLTGGRRRAE